MVGSLFVLCLCFLHFFLHGSSSKRFSPPPLVSSSSSPFSLSLLKNCVCLMLLLLRVSCFWWLPLLSTLCCVFYFFSVCGGHGLIFSARAKCFQRHLRVGAAFSPLTSLTVFWFFSLLSLPSLTDPVFLFPPPLFTSSSLISLTA